MSGLLLFIYMSKFQLYTSPDCGPCHALKVELTEKHLIGQIEVLSIEHKEHRDRVIALGARRVPVCVIDGVYQPNPTAFVEQLMEAKTT